MTEKQERHRGGARPGAGRKPNPIKRCRHTVYCSNAEMAAIKQFLEKRRRTDRFGGEWSVSE